MHISIMNLIKRKEPHPYAPKCNAHSIRWFSPVPWFNGSPVHWFHSSLVPCMVPWFSSYLVRIHGSLVLWFTVPQFFSSMVPWFSSSLVPWFTGSPVLWLYGSLVLWFHSFFSSMVPWFTGSLVLLYFNYYIDEQQIIAQ